MRAGGRLITDFFLTFSTFHECHGNHLSSAIERAESMSNQYQCINPLKAGETIRSFSELYGNIGSSALTYISSTRHNAQVQPGEKPMNQDQIQVHGEIAMTDEKGRYDATSKPGARQGKIRKWTSQILEWWQHE